MPAVPAVPVVNAVPRADATVPSTMTAVVQDRYGRQDVLEVREVPVPEPGPGQVLVEVVATSLNAADWHIMAGLPYVARLAVGPLRPASRVQGRDVAGRVRAVGAGVTAVRVGDDVVGRPGVRDLDGGGFAQYAIARPERLVPKPPTLSFEDAAAIPLAASTALLGLREGDVGAATRVLVNGSSGGVGTFAVQLAVALGAEVTGVCSTRNVELVRSLGAHHVVDYTRGDVTRRGERYDVVLDMVGTASVHALRRVVTPDGVLVLGGGGKGRWLEPMPTIAEAHLRRAVLRQRVRPMSEAATHEDLAELVTMAGDGRLRPVVERVLPLTQAREAMRHLLEDHARGKIVLVP
ncbi:NAD(P)-dependent alcohol dehydrogenase [Actinotalea solisilvae]|uniref:NAD(P)-dependent alcohol dehydrogenase n=1 Tax=Actinotalea solisilvae TaxID=2072922 RepID=UPI0018F26A34|nr:NAD(P)-dependent alcohol dehydrogenase [Actinotalea solisilvae]